MSFIRPALAVIVVAASTAVVADASATARPPAKAASTPAPVNVTVGGAVNVKIVTPAPAPTPTPTPTPVPTPTPTPTPLILKYVEKTIFVVSLASDAPTVAKISNEVALQMNGGGGRDRIPSAFQNPFFPEPTWQLPDYLMQCSRDHEHTAGALVIMPPVVKSATNNFLVGSSSWTSLDFFALLADCDESGQANVIWKSNAEYSGRANVASVSLLSLLVGYNAIANHSGSNSTSTTTTFPTAPATPTPSPFPVPAPTAPPPFVSQQVQSTTSNSNGNSNIGLIGTALAGALGNTASAGVTSGVDYQVHLAAQRATKGLVTTLRDLKEKCNTANPPLVTEVPAPALGVFCRM